MAQKYKKKPELGKEYITAAKKLREYTYFKCMTLPKEWEKYITGPMIQSTDRMEELAIRANKIYIKDKTQAKDMDDLLIPYQKRIDLLREIVTESEIFEARFTNLMDQTDLLSHEVRRIKSVIQRIIEQEEADHKTINIQVRMNVREIEFEALSEESRVKLGITASNRDYWLKLLTNVREYTIKRIRNDTDLIANLQKQVQTC